MKLWIILAALAIVVLWYLNRKPATSTVTYAVPSGAVGGYGITGATVQAGTQTPVASSDNSSQGGVFGSLGFGAQVGSAFAQSGNDPRFAVASATSPPPDPVRHPEAYQAWLENGGVIPGVRKATIGSRA